MDTSITQQIQQVFAAYPNIHTVIIFGSIAADSARVDSDLDVAVSAGKPLDAQTKMQLIADLAMTLGRPVDLVDLTTVGEPLLGQILVHGRRVLGNDGAYATLLNRHLLNQADFVPYQKRILKERRQAWIGMSSSIN